MRLYINSLYTFLILFLNRVSLSLMITVHDITEKNQQTDYFLIQSIFHKIFLHGYLRV